MYQLSILIKKLLLIQFIVGIFYSVNGQSILPNNFKNHILESNLASNAFLFQKGFVQVRDSIDRKTQFYFYKKLITAEEVNIKRTEDSEGAVSIIIDYLPSSQVAYNRFVSMLPQSHYKFDKTNNFYRNYIGSYEYLTIKLSTRKSIQDEIIYQINCTLHIGKELSMPPLQ